MSGKSEPHSNRSGDSDGISDDEAARLWAEFLQGANPSGLAAFDRLYQHFLPMVFRYCRSRLRDLHQAEDVANTVFVRLLETKPALRSSFIGLLLGTARNMCATERARRMPIGQAPDEAVRDAVPDIERRDTRVALAECMSRLSERDQTLVVLRHGEGLTYRQIRDVLDVRSAFSTLQRRLIGVLAILRRCLKEKNIF